MGRILARGRAKVYVRIPDGEIQLGRASRSIVVWFRGRKYRVKGTNWDAARRWLVRNPSPWD